MTSACAIYIIDQSEGKDLLDSLCAMVVGWFLVVGGLLDLLLLFVFLLSYDCRAGPVIMYIYIYIVFFRLGIVG